MLGSLLLFAFSVPLDDHIYTASSPQPIGMTIGFIASIISATAAYQIQSTLLSKSLANCTMSRGLILGATAFVTSIGVLIISYGGGHLYGTEKRSPAFISIAGESLTVILIIVLACAKELSI